MNRSNPVSDARPTLRACCLIASLQAATVIAGCASTLQPPQISYDTDVPPLPLEKAAVTDETPRPVHVPPRWAPARGGAVAGTPTDRVENANAAARVEPRREGYFNAIQVYPWSEGALYQVYASPGRITTLSLEAGESLTGSGPIAAGDTTRWIIGETESGSGVARRVHVLVKPTRPDITTNLVITTDRRTYMIELRAADGPYMPSIAWAYPPPTTQRQGAQAAPSIPTVAARNYRYSLTGDTPPWRPVSVYDDGRRVYVEFPGGIVQGEMPPIFVIGPEGEPEIVNSRVHNTTLIVDRLFSAAELRLGSGDRQQTVRIVRTDGVRSGPRQGVRHVGGASRILKSPIESGRQDR
jgi:type IV secretion system protein TrbG